MIGLARAPSPRTRGCSSTRRSRRSRPTPTSTRSWRSRSARCSSTRRSRRSWRSPPRSSSRRSRARSARRRRRAPSAVAQVPVDRAHGSRQSVRNLAVLRLVVGVVSWLAPTSAAGCSASTPRGNPQAPYLARLFGIRDLALGVGTLQSTGEAQEQWLRARHPLRRRRHRAAVLGSAPRLPVDADERCSSARRRSPRRRLGSRRSGARGVGLTPRRAARLHVPAAHPAPRGAAREGRRRDRRDATGVIGDVTTVSVARREAIREITVEVARQGARRGARDHARRARGRVGHLVPRPRVPRARRRQARRRSSRRRSARTRTCATSTRPASRGCRAAIAEYPELAGRFTMIGRSVADLHERHARARARRHRAGREHAGHGGQGALLRAARRDLRRADPHRHEGRRRVRRDRRADRAGVRRHPPRGHLGARVLRDRAAADRGASPSRSCTTTSTGPRS